MRPGRHSRNKRDWGTEGARSQDLAKAVQDDPAKKTPPGRKDRDFCKSAHWKGPHVPELILRRYGWIRNKDCHWGLSWSGNLLAWICYHEEVCEGCGKILRTSLEPGECPLYHEITPHEELAVQAEIARRRQWLTSGQRRSIAITGPQGYRKKRE